MQDVFNAHALVGGAFEARDVIGDELVDAFYIAVFYRRADQQRGDRFGHRKRDPARLLSIAVAIAFEQHVVALQHDEPARGRPLKVIGKRIILALDTVAKVTPVLWRRRQRER